MKNSFDYPTRLSPVVQI